MRFGEHKLPELLSEVDDTKNWSDEDLEYVSGWIPDKIQRWIDERPCEKVEWVTPSIERRF